MHRPFPFNPSRRCRKALALATLAFLAANPAAAQNFGNVVDHAIRSITNPAPGRIATPLPSDPYTDGRVILYRTSWCGYCRKAASFMQRNNIPFVERDVEANRAWQDEQRRLGGRGVPFMVFGSRTLSGYNEQLIARYYREMPSAGGGYGGSPGHAPRPHDDPGYGPGGHPPPPPHVYPPVYPVPMPPPGAAGANGPLPGEPLALRMSILNLHVGPDSDAPVSVTLTGADRVVYLGETRNGMHRVASDKGEGWVNNLHVRSPRGAW